MKIAIVGGRSFDDYEYLNKSINDKLSELNIQVNSVISGGAKGADSLGERYADEHSLEKIIFKAQWDVYGKSAGFIRNADIIKACDICFAFWDGESKGTKHDIDLCKKYDKECFIYKY